MTEREKYELACGLSALGVFRGILRQPPMTELLLFLKGGLPLDARLAHYGAFVAALAPCGYDFSEFLRRAVFADENEYVVRAANRREIPDALARSAEKELALFSKLTKLSSDGLCAELGYCGYYPSFENKPVDFPDAYAKRISEIGRFGYGIFASAGMFRVGGDGTILPVRSADRITVDRFIGYEAEREKVFENTRALVAGKPAANILLYGDAGTGKSSTVKACANRFFDDGVRLIELRKDQLFSLAQVMERIADNPLKFIVFIDDLSFNKNDDCFSMLKAALEGSASAKAKNAVIYATSNRRHIVKESFSDRGASDDIHANDTVQELMSLSDRFGLTVYFSKPDKALYLEIVRKLAEKNGVSDVLPPETLALKAEAYALQKGSRSPRAAEQFVNALMRGDVFSENRN